MESNVSDVPLIPGLLILEQPLHSWLNGGRRHLVANTVLLDALVFFILYWWDRDLRRIPKIKSDKAWFASRADFAAHGVEIIDEGYRRMKSGVFRTTSLDGSDLVLLAPENWLAMCKKKDDEVAPARVEVFLCSLHGAPFEDPFLYTYFYSRMPGFERYLDIISSSLDEAMKETLGCKPGSTKAVHMQPQILHVYSHVIWRVILGADFDPAMVAVFKMYSETLIPLMKRLKAQRPWRARITAALSREIRRVNVQLGRATGFLAPILSHCLKAVEQAHDVDVKGAEEFDNEWLLQLVRFAPAERRTDFRYQTNVLIGFAFTFVFSPGPSTTQVVYEFAFRPDYVDLVHAEASAVLGEDLDGWRFSKESVRRLTLLDNFCKETHKHHPTAASWLHDSQPDEENPQHPNPVVLPRGTVFEVVMTAAHLANPAFAPDGHVWDGHRYHKLRQAVAPGAVAGNKYEWGVATRDDDNFGYAAHMCPGRWAGCTIAKMFLVKLLARWDVRLEDGEMVSYEDLHSGQYILPNPEKLILLRPRTGKVMQSVS